MNDDKTETAIALYDLLEMTSMIVSAHISNNQTNPADVPVLIRNIYLTLKNIDAAPEAPAHQERPEPAVPIRKSITPDYVICLEDGRKLKMLKRHLKTTYNMTPDDYRARWGLPTDYPMVAPNYAAKRSSLAQEIGLGKKNRKAAPAPTGRRKKK